MGETSGDSKINAIYFFDKAGRREAER